MSHNFFNRGQGSLAEAGGTIVRVLFITIILIIIFAYFGFDLRTSADSLWAKIVTFIR